MRSSERRSKGRRDDHGLAAGEIIAEETRHDQIVAAPLLGTGEGIAHRWAWLDREEIFEREVNGPRIELFEMCYHFARALAAVGTRLQSGERGTRERPIGPQRVLHDSVDGYLRVLQQPHSFAKLRLILELARVGKIGSQWSVDRFQAVQARRKRGGRGIAWGRRFEGRRRGGRTANREPPRRRPWELPACPRGEPKPDSQTEEDGDEMLQTSHPPRQLSPGAPAARRR